MKTIELAKLGTLKNGMNFTKSASIRGCKIIGVSDFQNNVFPVYSSLAEIDSSIVKETDLLQDGDIVFVRSNGNKSLVGRSMIIKGIIEPICYSGFCISLRPNQDVILPEYLFYALRAPYCRVQYSYSQQTNITNLSQSVLGSVKVPYVPVSQQKKIAQILTDIDNKIALNQRINAELETMAKTIYDYWFVQFDFPDENGKPYRTSGGAMEWNEQLKREIPKGWNIVTLNDILTIDNTSINPAKLGATIMEHYSIPAYDVNHYPALETADTIESGKYMVCPGSILVSKLNPKFKRIWDPFCITDKSICSTEFMVYQVKNKDLRPFCFALLNSDDFYGHMTAKAISSTGSRSRIQPDVSLTYCFATTGNISLLRSFCEIYQPIMDKQKKMYLENYELTRLRDWLLPLLMNGQATVE